MVGGSGGIGAVGVKLVSEFLQGIKLPIGFGGIVDFHKLLVGELANALLNSVILAVLLPIAVVDNSDFHISFSFLDTKVSKIFGLCKTFLSFLYSIEYLILSHGSSHKPLRIFLHGVHIFAVAVLLVDTEVVIVVAVFVKVNLHEPAALIVLAVGVERKPYFRPLFSSRFNHTTFSF